MRKLFLAALLVSAASVAGAADISGTPYVGVTAGFTQYMEDYDYGQASSSYSNSGGNFALFAGWRWQNYNQYFAGGELKLRLSGHSRPTIYRDIAVDVSDISFGISAQAGKWITPRTSLYGIVGLNHHSVNWELNDRYYNYTYAQESSDYQSIEFGLGSDYRFGNNWSLKTQLTYDKGISYEYDNEEFSAVHFDIGVTYSF